MKKGIFTISICLLSASMAFSQNRPEACWGNLFGGSTTAGDNMNAVALGKGNTVVWLNSGGSTETNPTIDYAGEPLFDGALYNAGNSYNNNLALICTDYDGAKKWLIYSNSGDFASGQGNVVSDSEGNVIFTAKGRHTDGMTDVPMNLIDAGGNKYEFGGSVDRRYYRLVIAKADSNGMIKWVKLADVSTAPAPAAAADAFTSDGFSSSALAVDDYDNIYVGGNHCADLTIDSTTLTASNVDYWDGSASVSCGNMFLVKLDKDGNLLKSISAIGDNEGYSTIQTLEYKDGLYMAGSARGNGALSLAATSFTPSDVLSPVIGCLDSDLAVDWLMCCPAEKVDGKSALQNLGITVCGDNLWLCGQYNEKICDSNSDNFVAATQGSLREGFIICFDRTNGEWKASADSKVDFPSINKLTGYFKAIQNPSNPDKVYVFGYAMDQTIGVFLREYDAATLEADTDKAWNIVTGGGVPTAGSIAYDAANGYAFVTVRGNKAFSLMAEPNDIVTENTQKWDVLMAEFKLPDSLLSDARIPEAGANRMQNNEVFDIFGRKVASDANNCTLAPGIYISNNKKFVVR